MKDKMFFFLGINVSEPSDPSDELAQSASKKSLSDEFFIDFSKVQNLTVFSIIYTIRIRFFGPRELFQKGFSTARYSNFRTAVGKLIFMALWRPDMQVAIQQLSTQVLNPTTESKRAVKQLIRYLEGTQHTCLRLEPRQMVQKGLLEIVGRSDSDWAGDSATRQSVAGYHCNVQNVVMCNRSLKQTAISLSSCEAEFYAASVCAGELLGLAELFNELHYDVAARLETDSDSARHILQRRGPGGLKRIEIRCLAIQQWVREKRLSLS